MKAPSLVGTFPGVAALILALGLAGLTALGAHAEEPAEAVTPDRACIEVGVEGSWIGRLDCLNADLRRLAQTRQNQVSALYGAIGAGAAPPSEIGLFNQSATEERLGSNFGKSAFPQRPPPATYTLPFGGGHH